MYYTVCEKVKRTMGSRRGFGVLGTGMLQGDFVVVVFIYMYNVNLFQISHIRWGELCLRRWNINRSIWDLIQEVNLSTVLNVPQYNMVCTCLVAGTMAGSRFKYLLWTFEKVNKDSREGASQTGICVSSNPKAGLSLTCSVWLLQSKQGRVH